MDDKILTDADLAALEPRKYVELVKAGKPVKVSTHRILAVHGGSSEQDGPAQFSLELSNRSGKATTAVYTGTTKALFDQFNELGVTKEFLVFREIASPLSNMPVEKLQDSAVRVSLINAIRRPPGYRTSHGYKVKSVIERLDGKPLLAFQEVAELGQAVTGQGYKAAPGSGVTVFMLHPDQPDLLNSQGRRLTPPKPPRKRVKDTGKTLL